MKVELKEFQAVAARAILDEIEEARDSVSRGKVQAVVLSAPTGSGKTITIASVIDQTFGGGDGVLARPDTVFLWLSDSPELNAQSKSKLLNACDNLPFHLMVTIDSDTFDEERLYPGHVYFINTQLLGKDKLLTQDGDRHFTFWETAANTIAHGPQDFILIIDEAHRGAAANDRNRTPIMQKFIKGSEEDGLPPVPLVLGMSATPQRFTTLIGNTNRTYRPINITPDDVRSSGLLKDMIIVHNPQTATPSDLTMLEEAARRWKQFTGLWAEYCQKENEKEEVRPILVVQVEDGGEYSVTRSPLADVVSVIERQTGSLAVNEIVHCFHDQNEIEAGGRIIRKLEASRIQESPDVKVVLFKTALSTGWDCPRAEIMMSFRRAQDPTSIAQLVGRMIRTPLARRIGTNEVLDTVELFLPHYSSTALEGVLARLRSPEAEEGVPTRVETATEEYARNPGLAAVFERLKGLPTYSVSRAPKMGEVKRALRLAGMLVHEGINKDADEHMRNTLTAKLKELRDGYAAKAGEWGSLVREGGEISVDVSLVAIGEMTVTGQREVRMVLSEENIDRLFDASGRKLAAGEGLHHSYWKRYHDHEKPNEAKLELFAIIQQPGALAVMEKLALNEFKAQWDKHKAQIQELPAAEKARFHALLQASGKPVQSEWELPEKIVEKKDGEIWKDHLYCNTDGEFFGKLNSWEKALLNEAMQEEGFVGWLRNFPRREWALCVPYESAGIKAFYPDFIIIRKTGERFLVDILEPHDDSRVDTWAKVRGLAAFADNHGVEFGRLIVARKQGTGFEKVDVNDPAKRPRARAMQSHTDLESLFS
jgi:type III restriction enzyme